MRSLQGEAGGGGGGRTQVPSRCLSRVYSEEGQVGASEGHKLISCQQPTVGTWIQIDPNLKPSDYSIIKQIKIQTN